MMTALKLGVMIFLSLCILMITFYFIFDLSSSHFLFSKGVAYSHFSLFKFSLTFDVF